jgi:hypothetical protein
MPMIAVSSRRSDGVDALALFALADLCLYEAKRASDA